MKIKFLVFPLLMFFFISPLSALDVSLSLEPNLCIKKSITEEALFFNGYFGSDANKLASLLEWNEKIVTYYGLGSGIELSTENNKFIFSNRFNIAFPYNKGIMTDSDWNAGGEKSTYSEFDNKIHHCYEFFSMFSYERKITSLFSLRPSFSVVYNYISFNAENGHGWYDMDSDSPHYYPDGKFHLAGIDYNSEKLSIFMNFALITQFSNSATLILGAGVSPFSFVLAKDRHLARDYETEDYIYNSFKNYILFTELDCKISEICVLSLALNANYFLFTKGDEYYNYDDGDYELSGQKAGYSYSDFVCKFGVTIFLFKNLKL